MPALRGEVWSRAGVTSRDVLLPVGRTALLQTDLASMAMAGAYSVWTMPR